MRIVLDSLAGVVAFMLLSVCLVACGDSHEDSSPLSKELCAQLWRSRYSNVAGLDSVAAELAGAEGTDNELRAIADNALGYTAMMKMDYSRACDLYAGVISNSDCEIERLAADVGLMTVCYRVSENRDFFDYRTNALSRIRRIGEELNLLSPGDSMRFMRAKIEFAIVSVCYFSNLCMQEEKAKALEYIKEEIEHIDDVSLRLYAEMIIANNTADAVERFNMLYDGAKAAKESGDVWIEANYNLLLAIGLRDSVALQTFKQKLPAQYKELNAASIGDYDFLMMMAGRAVEEFRNFGDRYMMIEALAVSASCNIEYGKYEDALNCIDKALAEVNDYYRRYYPERTDLCVNSLDDYSEGAYSGNVQDEGVYNIPECMLSVRREACCAFAGLGDKYSSDINRNAYLELLETTRLNKHMESRVSHVEEDSAELDILLAVIAVLLIVAGWYIVVMIRKRRRHELLYSVSLKKLHKACRTLLASLPREIESKDELCVAVSQVLNDCLGNFSGRTCFFFATGPEEEGLPNRYEFSLRYLDGGSSDTLFVETEHPMGHEQMAVMEMVVPYVAVAIEEGLRLADIGDERMRAEEEHQAYSIYLAEHKRENLLKRVSLSIVGSMRPFMDRINGELKMLAGTCRPDDAQRKLQYIAELASKLDDYNIILEKWIKMRQGDLNLQIENFSLDDVFAVVAKSKALLEKRGVELEVGNGAFTVKADKALTLFMVNTLVDNAAKFTSSGGKVVLESVGHEDCVEISVTDTGIGISQADIDRILGEKVYDASGIGRDNEHLQPKKKGGGFGLMNCKGIIEKYRKSGEIFSVCSMNIESVKGQGSRFSFRLPKGFQRVVLLLLAMQPFFAEAQYGQLDIVSSYADSVYYSNMEGKHEDAFVYADKALCLLNDYYRENIGGEDTLSLYSGTANEIKWWREELFADSLKDAVYFNILDIRNEVAVASLAMQKWRSHRYNNYVYTTLYRMTHEDKGIAERYTAMRAALNYRMAAAALLLFMLLIMVLYIIVSYVRHNIIHRKNENMLLDTNRQVLQLATGNRRIEAPELLQGIAQEIYDCMGEGMRMTRVAIMLRQDSAGKPVSAEVGGLPLRSGNIFMLGVIDSGERFVSPDGMTIVLPLFVNSAGQRVLAGAIEVVTLRPLTEDEVLNLELVASYTASVAYHALVRMAGSYMALEEIEEQIERVKYEENRLHVQNMVLDNCLSVLKHETIYYPSRIHDIAAQAVAGAGDRSAAAASIAELMDYYCSIFGILSNCAKREIDDRCFVVSKVEVQRMFEYAANYAARLSRKSGRYIALSFEPTAAVASVDADLVEYLLESLVDAAFRIEGDGTLLLRATDTDNEVKIELVDNRYELASDEIADLFVPTRRNIAPDGTIHRMEYLVAKEIVRLHEDNTGHRGSRMEARSDVGGTVILFTLPKSLK